MLLTGFVCFSCGAAAEHLHRGTLSLLLTAPFRDPVFCISVLYLSLLSSLLAFYLTNLAIARIGTNRTATFAGIDTAVSILLGAAVQHDAILPWQIVGVTLILFGVYLANSARLPRSGGSSGGSPQ